MMNNISKEEKENFKSLWYKIDGLIVKVFRSTLEIFIQGAFLKVFLIIHVVNYAGRKYMRKLLYVQPGRIFTPTYIYQAMLSSVVIPRYAGY